MTTPPLTVKDWVDAAGLIVGPDTNGHYWRVDVSTGGVLSTVDLGTSAPSSTPLNAAALEDLETRLAAYADTKPAFCAYPSAATSVGTGYTKVTFGNEEFDTDDVYDASLSRLVSPIAGIWRLSAAITFATNYSGANTQFRAVVYKNGTLYKMLVNEYNGASVTSNDNVFIGTCLAQAAASDYFEIYALQTFTGAGLNTGTSLNSCRFEGHLIRT